MKQEQEEKQPLRERTGSQQVREKVATIIREARLQNGWTRYELAKRAEMSEAHIMRIEQEQYAIRVDIFNHLCKTLGIQIEFPIA